MGPERTAPCGVILMQTRYYRSKIGRLPWALRNELNERMLDGATGPSLLSWLNDTPEFTAVRAETGCADLNAQNLTDWRNTGYADWLDEKSKTDRLQSLASLAEQIAARTGGDPASVGCRIAAGKLLTALESAEGEAVDDFAKSFASLRSVENDAARVRLAGDRQRLDEQRLSLEKDKFRRTLCEEFLRLTESKRAMEIASGKGSNSEKIQALLDFMDKEQSA